MQLSYNGFSFSDIRTLTFDQKPIYTDDGVEYLYDEFTIAVSAIFNNSSRSNSSIGMLFTTTGFAPGLVNESPAATYNRLLGCLSQKRGQLIFSDTDSAETVVVNSPEPQALTDAKWGPEPQVLSIKQVTPTTWEIEWSVKTWMHKCCGNNAQEVRNTTPFIANRWSESTNYDDEFYATITRTGTLYFRADTLIFTGRNLTTRQADFYRSRIVAANPLRPNFMRTSSQYEVSSDGLQIKYTITDKQVYCMPLIPAIKVKSTYKIVGNLANVFQEEISVQAWGGPLSEGGTNKTQLFAAAHRIAMSRLDEFNGVDLLARNAAFARAALILRRAGQRGAAAVAESSIKLISNYEWIEDMMENRVEIRLKTFGCQRLENTYFGQFIGVNTGFNPVVNKNAGPQETPPNPGVYGSVPMQMVSAVTCDPCLQADCLTMPALAAAAPAVL